MGEILFGNPVFKDGLQFTTRKGERWMGVSGIYTATRADTGEAIASIRIVDTMHIPRFVSLMVAGDVFMSLEHDPECRTFKGLWEEMTSVYPDFKAVDDVTLVFFIVEEMLNG